ncbi:type II toxin-antitoxin system RelE/ParE family toxin [Dokdonia sinensis]|uniref:Type II toxin-antitoxin system RelE/ParE family toxin n=1 Tax=Dokdonia sinensis TaxID=2479847 RepID=A0A3M0GQ69_9FLAO|nr:type II toxin-antitoxin system RelE/ParE family toxin [Dokdonia sinensis]RMB63319.1 type II toxin-antitoxin system RelE/ParE family toxin [Dokdonia sinensis]
MKKVAYSKRGSRDFHKLKEFYNHLYGEKKTRSILEELDKTILILESPNFNFKESGEIDQQFDHLEYEYRKLIHHHCKITYREGKEFIYVVRVFDTRQAPDRNL